MTESMKDGKSKGVRLDYARINHMVNSELEHLAEHTQW
jgi:hypothetical protein